MIVPISDQASQQIGTPQEWTLFRGRSAQHYVISAAGPRVLSIQHEFLGTQTALAREFVEHGGVCLLYTSRCV